MRRRLLALALFSLLPFAAGFAPSARADEDEKPVKEADVPKAVVEALQKKYPKCVVKSWMRDEEDKKVSYEARIEVTAKDKDGKELTRKLGVTLSDAGKILEEEEAIDLKEVPEAVTKALAASKYGKAKILRVERIVKEEKTDAPLFEVQLEVDGKKVEVVFDKAGKIVEEEGDDDDEGKEKPKEGGGGK